MNFAWIANIFGSTNIKKDGFSVKRIANLFNTTNPTKSSSHKQIFKLKKANYAYFFDIITHPSYKIALTPISQLNCCFSPANNLPGLMKQQMLFPHHGFW